MTPTQGVMTGVSPTCETLSSTLCCFRFRRQRCNIKEPIVVAYGGAVRILTSLNPVFFCRTNFLQINLKAERKRIIVTGTTSSAVLTSSMRLYQSVGVHCMSGLLFSGILRRKWDSSNPWRAVCSHRLSHRDER